MDVVEDLRVDFLQFDDRLRVHDPSDTASSHETPSGMVRNYSDSWVFRRTIFDEAITVIIC